jgi:predicted dehydrogenase
MRRVTASGGHLSDLDIDVEDTVDATLEGGAVPVTVRQRLAVRPPRRTIAVEGDRGAVMLDLLTGQADTSGTIAPAPRFADYQRNRMFMDEAAHFLACVAGRETPAVPLEEGIAVLRLALAVKAAIRSGRPEEVA